MRTLIQQSEITCIQAEGHIPQVRIRIDIDAAVASIEGPESVNFRAFKESVKSFVESELPKHIVFGKGGEA